MTTPREIVVGIEESASYVEDMWPDEVAFLVEQSRGAEATDDLSAAWKEAEEALPEGWWIHDLAAYSFDDMAYRAEAATAGSHFWAGKSEREKRAGTRTYAPGPNVHAFGSTPAAALRALAAALRETKP